MSRIHHAMLLLACCAALVACGKEDAAKLADRDTPSSVSTTADADVTAKSATTPPGPDLSLPLSSYVKAHSGRQIMYLYSAVSKLPPNFEEMAQASSNEYWQTTDAFRKSDIVKAIRPQLEQGIAEAATQLYMWVELKNADLKSYDFQRKGFPVEALSGDRTRWFDDEATQYRYTWPNSNQVMFAPVSDQNVAREVESLRKNLRLKVYFLAQSAQEVYATRVVEALVTRVQIVAADDRVLVEYGPDSEILENAQAAEKECTGNAADCVMSGF